MFADCKLLYEETLHNGENNNYVQFLQEFVHQQEIEWRRMWLHAVWGSWCCWGGGGGPWVRRNVSIVIVVSEPVHSHSNWEEEKMSWEQTKEELWLLEEQQLGCEWGWTDQGWHGHTYSSCLSPFMCISWLKPLPLWSSPCAKRKTIRSDGWCCIIVAQWFPLPVYIWYSNHFICLADSGQVLCL